MRHPSFGVLLAAGVVGVLLLSERAESQGTKPPAHDAKSMGRGGTGMASWDSPTSIFTNPAALAWQENTVIEVMPALFNLDAAYEDPENPKQQSRTKYFPYANSALMFDFNPELTPEEMRWREDYYRFTPNGYQPPAPHTSRVAHRHTTIKVDALPRSVQISGSGSNAILFDASVVAHYGSDARVVGSLSQTCDLSRGNAVTIPLSNPMTVQPDRISVIYKVQSADVSSPASATVDLSVDGRQIDRQTVSLRQQDAPRPRAPVPPPLPRDFISPYAETVDVRFAVGEFIQSGAGSDFNLRTELYPEGTKHFTEFSFISLTPTVAFNFFDRLAIGVSGYLNYAQLSLNTPVTKLSRDVLQGQIFPTRTLTVDLFPGLDLGFFGDPDIVSVDMEKMGLPNKFGEAVTKILDTSPQHAPGTSITHTDKGHDDAFRTITGQTKIKDAVSFGFGGRIGFMFKLTDRIRLGGSAAPPSYQRDYKGKARIDYNRQMKQYETVYGGSPVGHSDEVYVRDLFPALTPFVGDATAESRFAFNDVWINGTVDIVVKDAPLLGDFTLEDVQVQNGSIRDQLPNKGRGADGVPDSGDEYVANYDATIKNFQMPADAGLGIAIDLTDDLTLSFDYRRVFWKRAMNNFHVTLTNGDNPDVNYITGSSTIDQAIPMKWRDQDVFAAGVEVKLASWVTVRTGYMFARNPVPPETLLPLLPVIPEQRASLGCSFVFGTFKLDVAWIHAFENSVTITNSAHTRDLNGSTLTVSQNVFSLGLSLEW